MKAVRLEVNLDSKLKDADEIRRMIDSILREHGNAYFRLQSVLVVKESSNGR